MFKTFTFNLTVEGIVDDAHLDELIDAMNNIAYVSNICKVSAKPGEETK